MAEPVHPNFVLASMLKLWDIIEFPFEKLGLLESTPRRFSVVAISTGLVLWGFKPKGFFDEEGNPRPNRFFHETEDSVYLDWAMFSLFMGGSAASFV